MDDKHKDSYIKIEDLHAWLVEHKDQIDWVNLRWTWSPNYIDCETNYVADGGDYDGFSIYAVFESMMIDNEYSYAGDIEGAIEFAEGYRCWNGKEFTLKCGIILEGEHDAYNADRRYREEDMDSEEWLDLSFVRLAIYIDGKQHPYKGLIRRREEWRCEKCVWFVPADQRCKLKLAPLECINTEECELYTTPEECEGVVLTNGRIGDGKAIFEKWKEGRE